MGINIYDMESICRIKKSNFDDALSAIRSLQGGETVRKEHFSGMEGPNHYSFVTTSKFMEAETFIDAMAAWRWGFEEDENGDAYDPCFLGEKLGDEEILFRKIAPFVEAGSFIQVYCHDDEKIWRWVFDGASVRREYAEIVFKYQSANQALQATSASARRLS